jgi:universal stress protein family protein
VELLEPQTVTSRRDGLIAEVDTRPKDRLANALVLTDFSPSSKIALPFAVGIAHQYHGKVVVAHVISHDMYEYAPPEFALRRCFFVVRTLCKYNRRNRE